MNLQCVLYTKFFPGDRVIYAGDGRAGTIRNVNVNKNTFGQTNTYKIHGDDGIVFDALEGYLVSAKQTCLSNQIESPHYFQD
jgi:hypothetical protein